MQIYPAIDIKDGKCVNLRQGKFDEITVFNENPVAVATDWINSGATYIHMVDLDGARYGSSYNNNVISSIIDSVNIPIQIGGGIRTMRDIEDKLNCGISRVILGTVAIKNPCFVSEAVKEFGNKIAVGIDAANGIAATDAWESYSGIKAIDLCVKMAEVGVKTIIYTDILKDGMLSGLNIAATKELVDMFNGKMDIIASGGVSCMADLDRVCEIGVQGVIIGRAIYDGSLSLSEVIKNYQ